MMSAFHPEQTGRNRPVADIKLRPEWCCGRQLWKIGMRSWRDIPRETVGAVAELIHAAQERLLVVWQLCQ